MANDGEAAGTGIENATENPAQESGAVAPTGQEASSPGPEPAEEIVGAEHTDELEPDPGEEIVPASEAPTPGVGAPVAVTPAEDAPPQIDPELAAHWEREVAGLEREATARQPEADAARLWYEAGLIHEGRLKNPRQAAVCFQTAFKLDPRFRPNIRSARKLFASVGNWTMLAHLLQAEADCTAEPERKAPLLFERAVILHDRLSKHDEARSVLEAAQSFSPDEFSILRYLEDLAARSGDFARLAEIYEREAARVTGQALKLGLLCAAAGLCADRLDAAERATRLFQQAHDLDPRHPVPIEALSRLHSASGSEALLGVLRAEAEATSDPSVAASALLDAARWAADRLGRSEEALSLLEQARAKAPQSPMVLQELAKAYILAHRAGPATEVLSQLAEITEDRRALAEVLRTWGRLLEEELGDEAEAAKVFRRMAEASPGNPDALAALGKLYFRAQRWDDLIWSFEQELDSTTDPKQRGMRLYKIAEIQEERLQKPEEATATLRRVLEVLPGYLPALQSLTRLYTSAGRWEDLIALHESEIEATDAPEQKVQLLELIARIREERLSDDDAAAQAYDRILQIMPDHLATVRRLRDLHARNERWGDLITILEREAELVTDQRQVIALLHRSCEILEEKVGDKDAAIEAYRKVLALSPNYLPALKSLGKLYYQKGKWAELVEMFRMEIEVTVAVDHVVSILLRIADIQRSQLLDEEASIETYRQVLEERPDSLPALRALRELYERRGEWDRVVDVLRRETEVMVDPREKAILLFRAAEIRELRSAASDLAAELYQEALSYHPGHLPSLRALERLFARAGAWRELAAVYERLLAAAAPGERVGVYRQLAGLYLDRLDQPAKASQCLEAVLEADPDDPTALLSLERLSLKQGAFTRVADLRGRLSGLATTGETAADLLLGAALVEEHLAEPAPDATPRYAKMLELTPGSDVAQRRIGRSLAAAGQLQPLVKVLEAQLAGADGDDLRLDLSMRLGEAHLELGNVAGAEAAFREALALDATHLPAIAGLKQAVHQQGKWEEVQQLLEREGEASRDAARAVELLLEAGILRQEHLGDEAGAEASYRKVIERNPAEVRAADRLFTILSKGQRWRDLAELHVERASRIDDPTAKAAALTAAADLYENQLLDRQNALEVVQQALQVSPNDGAALERAANLAFANEAWETAASLYTRRVDAGGDPRSLVHARLRLGQLYQERLGDFQRATAYYQDVLAAQPGNVDALGRLIGLQKTSGNWPAVASGLSLLADEVKDPARRVEILLDLADVHANRHQDAAAAAQVLEQVRQLDPYNVKAVETLGSYYEGRGEHAQVAKVYESFVAGLPESEAGRAAPIHARLGELYGGPLGEPQTAMKHYRQAVDLDPEAVAPRIALADLYGRDPALVRQAVDEHRQILQRDPLRIDSYHSLFTLYEAQKAFDKAFVVAGVLHFLGACDNDESFFYTENRSRLPTEHRGELPEEAHDRILRHPLARHPLHDVLKIVGHQLGKVHPPDLAAYQVQKGDKIAPKDNSPLRRLCEQLLAGLGGGDFELYRADRVSTVRAVLPNDPPAVLVSKQLVQKYPVRGQRFLLGTLMEQVRGATSLTEILDGPSFAATLQAAIQVVRPDFQALAADDPALAKRCAKSMSRKARKSLEEIASRLSPSNPPDIEVFVRGVRLTNQRAGIALSGDPESCLELICAAEGKPRRENIAESLHDAQDTLEALRFLTSDEHFRLRELLGLVIA
ncbi:MAG: tetratricopeptide repeat protein [Deltaproteobacteria bacterium]|nr:tetratricopeptide repeat protein [Deltaproteobacteria bacterium]